ncbi:MAG TPA: septum formation initiator family protein [Rhodospirillaceae bacterium]|nr:septum formation initiator family protein [Rhodospirillaceae bacterium]
MRQLLEHNDLVRKNLLTLVGLGLCFYFSYHLLQGERSYFRLLSLEQNILDMKTKNDKLKTDHAALETRVSMLRSGSIDKDLLEERARIVLGFRNQGEKDIMVGK